MTRDELMDAMKKACSLQEIDECRLHLGIWMEENATAWTVCNRDWEILETADSMEKLAQALTAART